ncbi:MAG: tetraacyldisaccharide 4'-kinase [Bacteroidaceae bacterium]|nr:tetraacyldisaccharide 4'-kinase [Bacteroidaceae bacterium]
MYHLITSLRNFLFDKGWGLKQQSFDVPLISVGNLAVGGTGKTPHTEYLVKLLQQANKEVAVLSRGYGRVTKGFRLASDSATASEIGDEPLQIKQKFPTCTVAVCEKRVVGMEHLIEERQKVGKTSRDWVVVLDDAFQHRYIKPGLSILLTDYARPYYADRVLPWGRLRESANGAQRADVIIVTKCPKHLSPTEAERIRTKLAPLPTQQVFFTCFDYGNPYAAEDGKMAELPQTALVLTGIAKPQPLYAYLEAHGVEIRPLAFADHHNFTQADAERINTAFATLPVGSKVITTEKDAVRLRQLDTLNEAVRNALLVQPIEVKFLLGKAEDFNSYIYNYVDAN